MPNQEISPRYGFCSFHHLELEVQYVKQKKIRVEYQGTSKTANLFERKYRLLKPNNYICVCMFFKKNSSMLVVFLVYINLVMYIPSERLVFGINR